MAYQKLRVDRNKFQVFGSVRTVLSQYCIVSFIGQVDGQHDLKEVAYSAENLKFTGFQFQKFSSPRVPHHPDVYLADILERSKYSWMIPLWTMITFGRCLRLTALLAFLPTSLGACTCSKGLSCMCEDCEISGTSVPASFLAQSCAHVVTLRLENRSLSSVHSEAFHGLASLTYLYLQDNQVRILDENLFSNNVVLKTLSVNGNPLRELRIRSASLSVLSAERCNLTDDHATFERLPALTILMLRRNAMVDVPRRLPLSLEVVDLAYNQLRKLNRRSLQSLPSLRVLKLDGNPLTLVTPASPSLRTLWIRGCHLSLEAVCLAHLPRLEELEAAGNDLRRVPSRLPESLQRLNLSGNALAETEPLGACLGPHYLVLDVSHNLLSDAQVKTLCSGAEKCVGDSQRQPIVAETSNLGDVVVFALATLVVLVTGIFIGAVLFWHCARRRPRMTYTERVLCGWRNSDTTYLVPSIHRDKAEQHTYIELV